MIAIYFKRHILVIQTPAFVLPGVIGESVSANQRSASWEPLSSGGRPDRPTGDQRKLQLTERRIESNTRYTRYANQSIPSHDFGYGSLKKQSRTVLKYWPVKGFV